LGEEVVCSTTKEVLNDSQQGVEKLFSEETDVIQQGVQNLYLFEEEYKMTVRAYVVAWAGKLYVSTYAYAVVHMAGKYDDNNLDYDVQVAIRNRGVASSVKRVPVRKMNQTNGDGSLGPQLLTSIISACRHAAPMFQGIVDATALGSYSSALALDLLPENDGSVTFRRYAVMGLDMLPQRDPKSGLLAGCQLLECNFFPGSLAIGFSDDIEDIQRTVNQPMLQGFMRMVLGDMGQEVAEEMGLVSKPSQEETEMGLVSSSFPEGIGSSLNDTFWERDFVRVV